MTAIAEPQLTSRVRDFISTDRSMLIGGEWTAAVSGKTFTTFDPATTARLPSPTSPTATPPTSTERSGPPGGHSMMGHGPG